MRNQIIRQQFANSDARRGLGFGLSGAPELIGVLDLLPIGQLRLLRDSNLQNKLELGDWLGINLTGFAGTAVRTIAVFASSAYTILATVQGLASDFSQGYMSVLAASFRRPASGNEVIVGTSTKIFEAADVVGATSSISGNGSGGISINFASNQAVLQYTWSFKYIVVSNVNP
jgi:hypothetical protein